MKRMTLRMRLMALMICLTTLPIVTITWSATVNTRQSVEKELIGANESRMLWADQYLNELIDQLDALFYGLQINSNLAGQLGTVTDEPTAASATPSNEAMRDTLTSAFFAYARKIDDLKLYDDAARSVLSVSYADSGTLRRLDLRDSEWRRIAEVPVGMYFKQMPDGIRAYHSINRFPDKPSLGGISAKISADVWREVAQILKSEPDSYVFIMNDEGELLSGSTPQIKSPEVLDRIHRPELPDAGLSFSRSEQYFYFMKRIGGGKLMLVKAIPTSTVDASALPTLRAGLLTGGLFVLASILLSILFALRITRPIVTLARTMRSAQLQSFEMKAVGSFDEIGLLQHGYNAMMQRIKELIEHEYRNEIDVKNAQLLALQAQINPHFLNNTLNLIGGMALAKQAPEIYRITRLIGEMLRYAIGSDEEQVTLQDEMTHIRNYVFIQEQRFAGRCDVEIECDESVAGCRMPRFILQPLVENAFEHGLQPKPGVWRLRIRAARFGETVAVFIQDAGVGMPPERLKSVRARLQVKVNGVQETSSERNEPKRRQSIGLSNVHSRLKLRFGAAYGVRLFSRADSGTLAVVKLPYPADNLRNKGGEADVPPVARG